jgi:hypothetical protein
LTNFSSTFAVTNAAGTVTVTGSKSLVGHHSRVSCNSSNGSLMNVSGP